ncbi:MAG: type IV secretion system DNA-binding domain-containing protein [Pseudomonadota bacterium]
MTTKKKSAPLNFIAGGDVIAHRTQLFIANWFRISVVFFASWGILWQSLLAIFVNEGVRTLFYKAVLAKVMKTLFMPGFKISVIGDDGEVVRRSASQFLRDIYADPTISSEFSKIIMLGSFSAVVALGLSVAAIWLYLKVGVESQKDKFLRGQKVVEPNDLVEMVKDPSPIKVGDVPIPKSLICRNFIAVGSMGVGKSQVIFPMLKQARGWGKKCVVYDKTGELVQKFYRPGKDFILSPVDDRCADWSILADLKKVTDPAMVSRFFVPENTKSADPVWDNAARMLLEDVLTIVHKQGGSMEDVRRIITQYSLDALSELLVEHEAPSCGVINPKNERGSESVRLTLTSQPGLRFFKFFSKKSANFSVRDFVRREDDACLFLVSNSTQHDASVPFISAWIELALAEAMSKESTMDVRLMFFLDELASLSKLSALDVALTEARKYGIVTIVGIQNLAQLEEIYGKEVTRTMVANLQNKFILRTEEQESAKQLADTLGKEEVEEVDESLSFGAEEGRDGVNLGSKRNERNLVLPTELMTLPDLTGWLKLAGNFPIAKVTVPYTPFESVNEGYVERDGLDLPTVSAPQAVTVATNEAGAAETQVESQPVEEPFTNEDGKYRW